VQVFAYLHIVDAHVHGMVAEFFELAAAVTGEANGHAAVGIGVFYGLHNVAGIAGTADADNVVAFAEEILQLFHHGVGVAHVVGIGHERSHVVVQADELEALVVTVRRALVEVAAEMRGCGRRTAITHDKDGASFITGFQEQIDEGVDLILVQSVERAFQPGHIFSDIGEEVAHQNLPLRECLL